MISLKQTLKDNFPWVVPILRKTLDLLSFKSPKNTQTKKTKLNRITKYKIINFFGENYGYQAYLEIATSTTGHYFSKIDRNIFSTTQRLLYNISSEYSDGLGVDYAKTSLDTSSLFNELQTLGKKYDIILVDPYHTYECSLRDIENAFKLLNDHGVIIVHDCNPKNNNWTSPTYKVGGWMGQTYLAFIDFVHSRIDLEYCVVDSDYGCGIIRRKQPNSITNLEKKLLQKGFKLEVQTDILKEAKKWEIFDTYRVELLHLIQAEQFAELYHNPEKMSPINN